MNSEMVNKLQRWLAENGQEKTVEETEEILQTILNLQKKLKKTSVESLWDIEEQMRKEMSEEELRDFMQIMYHAKSLGQ